MIISFTLIFSSEHFYTLLVSLTSDVLLYTYVFLLKLYCLVITVIIFAFPYCSDHFFDNIFVVILVHFSLLTSYIANTTLFWIWEYNFVYYLEPLLQELGPIIFWRDF